MGSEWQKIRFSDILIEPTRNGLYKPKDFHGRGSKIVNMGELFGNPRLYDIPMQHIETTESERKRFCLKQGDLIFARRSLVADGAGKCSIFLGSNEDTVFESSIIRARPDQNKASCLYLFYFFDSPIGKYHLGTIARQVAVAGITGSDLVNLSFSIPPIQEQHSIADLLQSFDKKIELNQRMNDTLEGITQALFKSWFVDFDPVKAKAEGRKPEGMDDATAALFPSNFTESPLGPIPEGWEISSLGDFIELAYGRALKANGRNEGFIPVYGSNGQIGWHDTALVKGPSVVVGRKGNPGTVIYVYEDFFPIDTTFFVIPSPRVPSIIFLYLLMERLGLPGLSADSAVPGLNRNAAYSAQCILPPLNLIENFNKLITPFILKKENLKNENKRLIGIRDLLLPRLISGKLRIADNTL